MGDALRYVSGLESPEIHVPEKWWAERPSWDTTYLLMTFAMSVRGECSKRKVAALIVGPNNQIITGGVNGTAKGEPSCLTGACPRAGTDAPEGSSYDTGPFACIAAHAEANALVRADWEAMQGGTIYISAWPCGGCLKQVKASGLHRLVFPKGEDVHSFDLSTATFSEIRTAIEAL